MDGGTVFELAQGSGTITTLASFNETDGANLEAGLVMDSSGNLYGTASGGGALQRRRRFSSWPRAAARSPRWLRSTAPTVRAGGRPDHGQQRQPVRHNSQREVPSSDGTVFELAQGSGTITTLASFNGTNGAQPEAALIMDSSGNLYGTTELGGACERRHGFRAGPRQRHDHHAGFVQRHQRCRARWPA